MERGRFGASLSARHPYTVLAMAADTFICVLLYVVSLLSLSLEALAQRSCSLGMFCPIGANCTSNTNLCVIHCPTETDHMQQGNHLTGNCERSKLCVRLDYAVSSMRM